MKYILIILMGLILINSVVAVDIWDESDYCTNGNILKVVNGWWLCAEDLQGTTLINNITTFINATIYNYTTNFTYYINISNNITTINNITNNYNYTLNPDGNFTYNASSGFFTLAYNFLNILSTLYYNISSIDTNFTNYYTKAQINLNFTNYYTKAQIDLNFTNYYSIARYWTNASNSFVSLNTKLGNTTSEIRRQFTGSNNISIDYTTGIISFNATIINGINGLNGTNGINGTNAYNITNNITIIYNITTINNISYNNNFTNNITIIYNYTLNPDGNFSYTSSNGFLTLSNNIINWINTIFINKSDSILMNNSMKSYVDSRPSGSVDNSTIENLINRRYTYFNLRKCEMLLYTLTPGSTCEDGFQYTGISGGAFTQVYSINPDRYGILAVNKAVATNTGGGILSTIYGVIINGTEEFNGIISINNQSNNVLNGTVTTYLGLMSPFSAAVNDGVYFSIVNYSVYANVKNDASSLQSPLLFTMPIDNTPSSGISADKFYRFNIIVNNDVTNITFSIYNSTMFNTELIKNYTFEKSTSIPSSSNTDIMGFGIASLAVGRTTATQKLINIDYVDFSINRTLIK